jgi:hypothetical protein
MNGMHDVKGTLARIPDIQLGPDLNWLIRGGIDPVTFIKAHVHQIVYMHIRDQYADRTWTEYVGQGVTNFAAIADAETCNYDQAGRKTKTRFLRDPGFNVSYGIEGTSTSVRCPGAAAIPTTYDDNGLPSAVGFLNLDGKLIERVTLLRDEAGRLLKEEVAMIGAPPWQGMHFGERQEAAEAAFSQIFANAFSSTSCIYDHRGRLIQRDHCMGTLGGDRTTYRYEDRDEAVEETTEHTTREASLNEDGTLQYSPGRSHIQHNRLEYTYDSQGNWTSRTVSFRLEPETAFLLSNIERREIEYYAA